MASFKAVDRQKAEMKGWNEASIGLPCWCHHGPASFEAAAESTSASATIMRFSFSFVVSASTTDLVCAGVTAIDDLLPMVMWIV